MYKFQPILKSTIWGGEKIVPYKHIASDQKQVGESWELSGVKGNELDRKRTRLNSSHQIISYGVLS